MPRVGLIVWAVLPKSQCCGVAGIDLTHEVEFKIHFANRSIAVLSHE